MSKRRQKERGVFSMPWQTLFVSNSVYELVRCDGGVVILRRFDYSGCSPGGSPRLVESKEFDSEEALDKHLQNAFHVEVTQ